MSRTYKYRLVWHGWGAENECVVIRECYQDHLHERFDYVLNAWVRDDEEWFRKVVNSNDNDRISEQRAHEVIERFGGAFYVD